MPTIRDIAKAAGVSVATVSYVINDKPGVTEETRQRIKALIEKTGYVPNSVARSLKTQKSDIIGLVVPEITNVYMSAFLKRIEHEARKNAKYLLIATTSDDYYKEKTAIEKMVAKNVDAIIFCPGNCYDGADYSYIKALCDAGTPVVMFNLPANSVCSSVEIDLEKAQFSLVCSLLEKGYKSPVFVGGNEGRYYTEIRRKGYTRACDEHGVSQKCFSCGGSSFAHGKAFAKKYLQENPLPDVFVCISDSVAYGIISHLASKGIKVPQDVSVTGFDGVKIDSLSDFSLTTVSVPINEMARKCFTLALSDGEQRCVLDAAVTFGQSTK